MSITVNVHGAVRGSFFFTQHELGENFWRAIIGGDPDDVQEARRLLSWELGARGIRAQLITFDWPSQSAEVIAQ